MKLIATTLGVLSVISALGCARREKTAPETARPEPAATSTQAESADADVEDEREKGAQELDAEFSSDSPLVSADADEARKPIMDAFAALKQLGVPEPLIVSPLECRQKLCRISIEVADMKAMGRVFGALTGRPDPESPKRGRLLPNRLVVARQSSATNGTVNSMIYIWR